MKDGGAADEQFQELATALRTVGAAWVVEEVEEITNRGKTVEFEKLPREDRARYEERLGRETRKGLNVRRARPTDEIGAPYAPSERLELLADAADRVVTASVEAQTFVTEFAVDSDLQEIILEDPLGADAGPLPEGRAISFLRPEEVREPLASLSRLLRGRVVD